MVALPRSLKVDVVQEADGVVVVTVAGEVDLATSPQLREELLRQLNGRRPTVLVVDLQGVSFLDSTGLSALVAAHRRAHSLGVDLRLTSPTAGPSKAFQVTGLDKAFAMYPTLAEALAAVPHIP
jgi:anti-sigma B factor antagonist